MAKLIIYIDSDQIRKVYQKALADAFLAVYDDFDNMESMLNVNCITVEEDE